MAPTTLATILALASALLPLTATAEEAETQTDFPLTIDAGAWPAGHVQGIAVDRQRSCVYFSFTRLLVKTDLEGKVLGTIEGFTGHLGDLDIDETDGRVYGSLEYKAKNAFYIAIINGPEIDHSGMQAQGSDIFQTVYLPEVVSDYSADLNNDGKFDGDTADTPDHRYGCSGIDGVSFGPRPGQPGSKDYLTVAYGIYSNLDRSDNDHQVLLQYDSSDWLTKYARPLHEAEPHHSGPDKVDGKFFIRTGNTTYGVQNLAYDEAGQRWLLGVYPGKKPAFPNYTLFAVEESAQPVSGKITGTEDTGLLLPLAPLGQQDKNTGIRGWKEKADVGIQSLGDGLFYLAENGKTDDGKQTATLTLYHWTGDETTPFTKEK
ncbi:hypothetical protein [Haloferula sp. BvORR071]|uniref:hypothetical protein n=1 Tax=Haloferula sp. BvORR071 TaxID=1396141 RepID=UPI000552C034|nr:hypothetical protein [Haloferula sp. BvORR071]